jgi:purine-nucleoside phosphorylase
LRALAPEARPTIAVVLGSGWGALTEHVAEAVRIPYAELPGFPRAEVPGHSGELWVGRVGGNEVAVMSGRKHTYEEGDAKAMQLPLQALNAWGCSTLVQTNAAGSCDDRMQPGSLMVVADHINMVQRSPLVGDKGAERFVDMVDAYDPDLRSAAHSVARRMGIALHEGVLMWLLGPQFETPSEVRMFRSLGAAAVGMSTVPETIIARHLGMKVIALSLLSNMAAGLSAETLSHEHTQETAARVGDTASAFLVELIKEIEA